MAEEVYRESSVQDQWGQICDQLKVEFGDVAFDSWLKPLTLGSCNDGIVNICVPTRFMRNWVILLSRMAGNPVTILSRL